MTSVQIRKMGDGPEGLGEIHVLEEPVEGAQYIIGADVAQGATFGTAKQDADESTLCVLRRDGMQLIQVCEAAYRSENYVFGQVLAAIGTWYNHAFVNVERNLAHGVIAGLKSSGYPVERWYVPPIQSSTLDASAAQYFFHKNASTQKVLLDTLIAYMDPEAPRLRLFSKRCLNEIGSLQRDANGAINTNGKDRTIALAMAVIVDATTEFEVELLEKKKARPIAPFGVDEEQWNELHGIKNVRPQQSDEVPDWEGSGETDDAWVGDWTEMN
jgi:hypothetical protein